jgi:hypothetical protein
MRSIATSVVAVQKHGSASPDGIHNPDSPGVDILPLMLRVYRGFMQRHGWHVYFMQPDLQTHLPCTLTFSDPQKIVEMAKRGGMEQTSESKAAFGHGISTGRAAAGFS